MRRRDTVIALDEFEIAPRSQGDAKTAAKQSVHQAREDFRSEFRSKLSSVVQSSKGATDKKVAK